MADPEDLPVHERLAVLLLLAVVFTTIAVSLRTGIPVVGGNNPSYDISTIEVRRKRTIPDVITIKVIHCDGTIFDRLAVKGITTRQLVGSLVDSESVDILSIPDRSLQDGDELYLPEGLLETR